MKTMPSRKIVFRQNQAEFVEQSLPEPDENQAIVQTNVSLLSPGTEKAALTQVWDDAVFRENPGYALAGKVIAAGANQAGIEVGDRVISLMNHASHSLASTQPWVTLRIPAGLSEEAAIFLPLASVALHAMRRARLEFGDTIVIVGLGIIGQIAVSLAKMQGARQVIAIDLRDDRLELARRRGAQAIVNSSREDAVDQVMHLTGGEGAPVILDSTGNNRVIPTAFKMAAVGGRVVTVGIINEDVSFHFYREFMQRELSLIAASQPRCPTVQTPAWRWTQQANRQLLLEWMAAGQLEVCSLITHRFQSEQAPDVYARLVAGDDSMLGVVFDWNLGES